MRAVSGEDSDQEFDELLLMLKETRGFDFTGYKRSTLMRRIRRRMDARALTSLSEYRDYLELEPEEFSRLFDSLLINVTGFFRDPLAWLALGEEVLPELLSAKSALRSLGSAVVVVDAELQVYVWGPGAEDLWGLRADEATGRPFADLDIGLPVADIMPILERTLSGEPARIETVIEAMNRRGRTVRMLLECLVLRDEEGTRRGVIMVMNDAVNQE